MKEHQLVQVYGLCRNQIVVISWPSGLGTASQDLPEAFSQASEQGLGQGWT